MKKQIVQKTSIPGPRSLELLQARQAAVPRGPYNMAPIFIARGEGALIDDVDGNRYIDFAGGIGVLNVGHTPGPVVRAVQQQALALHAARTALLRVQAERLVQRVNLHLALGGSF